MISILMAVRSGWQYMPEAVESVRAQTYLDWELLIAVNGLPADSSACTLAVGYHNTRRISPFLWPECPNKPAALNRLVPQARGDHIAILDVDDVWLPNKLEKQIPFLGNYDVVGTLAEYFGQEQGPIGVKPGEVLQADLLQNNHIINSSVIIKRGLAEWEDSNGSDDYPLWLKLAHEGRTFYNVPEVLTRIRIHPDQWYAGKRDNSVAIRQEWAAKV